MTKSEKAEYIATEKRRRITTFGCTRCKVGIIPSGFEHYWDVSPYNPRRFVFVYTDPRASDVPVSKLALDKTSNPDKIREALARCVILCRTCAKSAMFRKDDQCQEQETVTVTVTRPNDL